MIARRTVLAWLGAGAALAGSISPLFGHRPSAASLSVADLIRCRDFLGRQDNGRPWFFIRPAGWRLNPKLLEPTYEIKQSERVPFIGDIQP